MRSAEPLLEGSLFRLITRGELRVRFASGRQVILGKAELGMPNVSIEFADASAEWGMVFDPALRLGELYMEGRLKITSGNVYDLIALMKRNGVRKGATPPSIAAHALRTAASYSRTRLSPDRSQRNVAHHYDLDARLFRLFLDRDLQYSCAYFEHDDQDLDAAQLAKKRHLAAKLLCAPDQRVLDIGCGWGGMALYLANVCGANVDGITLSEEQLTIADQRAQAAELSERVHFQLKDYRGVDASYDRIISVGMFEHVGLAAYDTFFEHAARLLDKRGIFVLHSIGRTRRLRAPSPFIDKYIFPDCYIPALSEVLPAVERAGFLIKDVEVLPLHYAKTLRAWRERFLARRDEVIELYDERFLRMWEFYLAASESTFRHDRMFVFQLQLCRHQDVVPIRRDYLVEQKTRLLAAEAMFPEYAALHDSSQRTEPPKSSD